MYIKMPTDIHMVTLCNTHLEQSSSLRDNGLVWFIDCFTSQLMIFQSYVRRLKESRLTIKGDKYQDLVASWMYWQGSICCPRRLASQIATQIFFCGELSIHLSVLLSVDKRVFCKITQQHILCQQNGISVHLVSCLSVTLICLYVS